MKEISINQFKKEIENGKKWILLSEKVYDVENFMTLHPGGAKIISSYIGRDATDAWTAMHPDKIYVKKFLKALEVGDLMHENASFKKSETSDIISDYREIRNMAEKTFLFSSSMSFFIFQYLQIILFETAAWLTLFLLGVNFYSYILCCLLITTAQAQAGWSQHDYGHLSVFNTRRLNKIMHHLIIGHIKGASSSWWNFRHNLHHSKPNIIKIDPDINAPYLFLLGSKLPIEWAIKKRGFMPYNFQHQYFFIFGPPILLPIYFHYENMYFMLKRCRIKDFLLTISFFVKFFFLYSIFFDSWFSVFSLYMTSRFFESFWFTMVTQMSHLPMEVDRDQNLDWATQQLVSTRNVTSNWFNDWFTGHLNFQIEHHLFPDMPRHNYHLIKPQIQEFCRKHGLVYVEKSLLIAFSDIIKSLKNSGSLWLEAYKNPG